ncbi:PrgI family protein [Candidatus Parcubacteria bacterium]|nr:MAG: PrgI family protein [Candidatus Parcubacteria bacterium]
MPEQFVVPQFLDVESKIIGPITARQFIILLVTLMVEFLIYRIFLNIFVVVGLGVPVLGIGLIFAFAKVNGQPFHFILLSMIQTFRKPFVRVWDKTVDDGQLRESLKKKEPQKKDPEPARKKYIAPSRLSDIALVVNTGGAYNPENDYYGQQ